MTTVAPDPLDQLIDLAQSQRAPRVQPAPVARDPMDDLIDAAQAARAPMPTTDHPEPGDMGAAPAAPAPQPAAPEIDWSKVQPAVPGASGSPAELRRLATTAMVDAAQQPYGSPGEIAAQNAGPLARVMAVGRTAWGSAWEEAKANLHGMLSDTANLIGEKVGPAAPPVQPSQDAEGQALVAEHANAAEQVIGGLAGLPPSMLDPKVIAAMIAAKAPTGAVMGSPYMNATLGAVGRVLGPRMQAAVQSLAANTTGGATFGAAHALLNNKPIGDVAVEAAQTGALGAGFGMAHLRGEMRRAGAEPVHEGIESTSVPVAAEAARAPEPIRPSAEQPQENADVRQANQERPVNTQGPAVNEGQGQNPAEVQQLPGSGQAEGSQQNVLSGPFQHPAIAAAESKADRLANETAAADDAFAEKASRPQVNIWTPEDQRNLNAITKLIHGADSFENVKPEDRPAIIDQFQREYGRPVPDQLYHRLMNQEAQPAPVTTETPDPATLSFADLQAAAKAAGIEPTVGRAEMVRQLKEKQDASQVGTPTALHGDVQPQPRSGPRQVPEPVGVQGVQPQAAGGLPEPQSRPGEEAPGRVTTPPAETSPTIPRAQTPRQTGRDGAVDQRGGSTPEPVAGEGRGGGTPQSPAPAAGQAPSEAERGLSRAAKAGEYTKADIERRLIEAHRATGLASETGLSDAEAEQAGHDTVSTSFRDQLPGEVRSFVEANPSRRAVFKVIKRGEPGYTTAAGADVLGSLGEDEYFRRIERMEGGQAAKLTEAKAFAHTLETMDPATKLLAVIHDTIPEKFKDRPKQAVIDKPERIPQGGRLKINGVDYEVGIDAGEPVLISDDVTTYLRALDSLPYDKGSLRGPEEAATPKAEKPADMTSVPAPDVRAKGEEIPARVTAHIDDLDPKLASQAFSNTSHVPEKRGEQYRQDYVDTFNRVRDRLELLAKTPEQQAALAAELERFRKGLIEKYRAFFASHSNVASPMVTGPARFPVERNAKRMRAADARRAEITELATKAEASIRRNLFPSEAASISSDRADAPDLLRKEIADAEKLHTAMLATNKIILDKTIPRDQKAGKIAALGFTDERANELLNPKFGRSQGFESYTLQNNRANIRRMQERVASIESTRARDAREATFEGGKIVENKDANRVQIVFDGKPDEATRAKLKSRGFRWSPNEGAWQRQLNEGAWRVANELMGAKDSVKPEPGTPPTSSRGDSAKTEPPPRNPPPPEPPAPPETHPNEPPPPSDTTGIAHRVSEARGMAIERGEGTTGKEAIKRGRKMLADGIDPQRALTDRTLDLGDRVALARAHEEALAKAATAAEQKYGPDSPEYRAAFKDNAEWLQHIKTLATEAHRGMVSHVGETDIDTGNFHSLNTEFQKLGKREMKPKEIAQAQRKVKDVQESTKEVDQAKTDLYAALDKANADLEAARARASRAQMAEHAERMKREQAESAVPKYIRDLATKYAERSHKAADAARERIRQRQIPRGPRTGSALPPEELGDWAIIGHDYIVRGLETAADFAGELTKEFGDWIKPHAQQIYEASKKLYAENMAKESQAVRKAVRKTRPKNVITPKAKPTEADAAALFDAAQKYTPGKPTEFKPTPEQAAALWRAAQEHAPGEAANFKPTQEQLLALWESAQRHEPGEAANFRPTPDQALALWEAAQKHAPGEPASFKPTPEQALALWDAARTHTPGPEANLSPDPAPTRFGVDAHEAGKPWTPEQASALWSNAKKKYLERGVLDFDDMVRGLATDFGLPEADIRRGLAQPKGVRVLTDAMYQKQYAQRQAVQRAKNWVNETTKPGWMRFAQGLPRALFTAKVFGHGTVGMVTHAGPMMFDPRVAKTYWTNFGRQYKLMARSRYDEMMMRSMARRPNYITARRAGLANEVEGARSEYETDLSAKLLGKIGLSGNRGFHALKLFRQDLFDARWDRLPESLRTKEMAVLIADSINHSTGFVQRIPFPKTAAAVLFAPKLEASRWSFLIGDPAKAAGTFLDWKKATPEAKHAAVAEVKQKTIMASTYIGALAINQGLLTAAGSDQEINFLHPTRSDWLSFKGFGHSAGVISPMIHTIGYLAKLAIDSQGDRTPFETRSTSRAEEMAEHTWNYARGKLSPFGQIVADIGTQADFENRPLPWSDDPVSARLIRQNKDQYTYPEYVLSKLLPIPAEAPLKEVMETEGPWTSKLVRSVVAAAVSTTGAHVKPDHTPD